MKNNTKNNARKPITAILFAMVLALVLAISFPTMVSADYIDTSGPTGDFFVYSQSYMQGTDVASYGDKIYVNNGVRINVYTVSISNMSLRDQHPSNPGATGPILPRTFTYEPSLSFDLPSGISAGTSHSELYVDSTGIYQAVGPYGFGGGVVKYTVSGGSATYDWVIHDSTVPNGKGLSFLTRDTVTGKFYSGNEYNTDGSVNTDPMVTGARRAVYGWDGTAWVEEFSYHGFPMASGMSHFDGMEFVRNSDGTGYMYVSDMTTDYIGQWRLNDDGSWTETNLFQYTDPSTLYVEGLGFGALGHFWASASTGSAGDVYEIGGCDMGGYIPYNPLNLDKSDDTGGACVNPGDTFTYTMSYTNGNSNTVTNVTITDTLPSEVTFVSCSDGCSQSGNTVTWNIGTLTPGESGSVTLMVQVNPGTASGTTITNYATIDSDQTPPTTQSETTDVCLNQPPTADAGPDQTVEQAYYQGADVTLDGSGSSDPDGDSLTYSWTWIGGSATGVSPTVSLPLGNTTITLVVNDGTVDSAPDAVVITVEDTTPPEITCPADVTVEQESAAGTVVNLTATATDICDADVEITSDELAIYPLGTTTVTFTATDDSGNSASCTTTVTVVDTTLPVISVTVSPDTLWPPNHKMVDIVATVTVSDICDATPSVVLTCITSDEPDDTKGKPYDSENPTSGDGNTVSDIQGADIGTEDYEFQLRAERAGAGDGRVYTITYTVTDASGNEASASATVVVPHDMG